MNAESANLLAAYLDGDQDGATQIFERYVRRLISLAASRLSERLNGRVDPDDIVQSAFRSFFRKADKGEIVLQRSGDLWRVLAAFTLNKVRSRIEQEFAAKKSPLKEESGSRLDRMFDREPTPDEAVALTDLVESYLKQLPPRDGQILCSLLQGESVKATADETGVAEATVRRVRRTTRDHFRKQLITD